MAERTAWPLLAAGCAAAIASALFWALTLADYVRTFLETASFRLVCHSMLKLAAAVLQIP